MRILGIDCGTERTGYGVIDSDGREHRLVAAGVIATGARMPFEQRLLEIARGLRDVIRQYAPEAAAVEGIFHAVNMESAFKLAHARGVALLAIAEAGLTLGEYSPMEVKMCVVGYGRAAKNQVQMMVGSLLGLSSPLASEDASDAVAVSICHATHAAARARLEAAQ
jgi:crossover junction endodeoxyribonuclease RuvC